MISIADRIDLDLVSAFLAVARTGSFTRAGEQVLRTQSAVSLQVRRLERVLGERLFRRNARAVTLTPAGERFLPFAEQLAALHDEALAAFRSGDVTGHVRLGTPEDFATAYLPRALARFAKTYPGVQLEVTCDLTLNLLDMYRGGKLDIALVKREPAAGADPQRVWAERLVWVGAGPALFAPAEVTGLVVSPEPCVYRKRAVDALSRAGRRARPAYVCGSLAGCLAAVRAGLGVAVLPEGMAPDDLCIDTGDLMPPLSDAEIVLLTQPDAGLPARRLAGHLARELEQVASERT